MINEALAFFVKSGLPYVINILEALAPVVLAFLLLSIAWNLWLTYVRAKYFLSLKYITLEIKLPKDQFKSPHAMEMVINAFHNTSDGDTFKQYWKGETRPWWSLELISIEGQVKFVIWLQEKRRNFIESSLYAQFPGIEIREIPDYAKSVYYDKNELAMWATEFKFTKEDPYPIKTYVDYGLDRDPKEEFKVDPLVPLLEYLGSVGPNQQVWFQFMIKAHGKDNKKKGSFFKKTDAWKDKATELVNEMLQRDAKTKVAGVENEKGFLVSPKITKGEEEVIEALERSITKHPFEVGIRVLYIAKKDFFDGANIGSIIGSMKHFSSPHLNGFKPGGPWGGLDFPWQDFKGIRKNRKMSLALMAYKRRSFFFAPFESQPLIMNSEELATIYHFPGAVAGTPTLERVPSKRGEAPSNLPI
jgi:hypothetical protein